MNDHMNDSELDEMIRRELLSVSAPADLRQKLLQPEKLAPRTHWYSVLATNSANDSVLRRALPVAACLVIALGITFWSTDYTRNRRAVLENEIFTHMYLEGQLDNANAAAIPLAAVNARMEKWMGAHLEMSDAVEGLEVTFAKDCWIAQQVAFHLIMKGQAGAVTVMMIPSEDSDDQKATEFNFSDEKYNGLVMPTDGGYLVVVGNKQEQIAEYRNLLSGKLEWEY